MNNMVIRRKQRRLSLWVEWNDTDRSESLVRALLAKGIRGVEIDRDVDLESFPSSGIKREHTVLRVSLKRDYPAFRLLAEVSMHPGVFSVGEL